MINIYNKLINIVNDIIPTQRVNDTRKLHAMMTNIFKNIFMTTAFSLFKR